MKEEPVLDIKCNLYPNIHPFVWLLPHLVSVSIPELGTIPFFIDDLCHIEGPLALISVLSIAVINGSTISSEMNRCTIAFILSLISTEIVFNLLSNVLLLGGE